MMKLYYIRFLQCFQSHFYKELNTMGASKTLIFL